MGIFKLKKLILFFLIYGCLLSCGKNNDLVLTPSQNLNHDSIVNVTIDQSRPENMIPLTFQGLSYETSILINAPSRINKNNSILIQLIKNLGPGILRLGGNSSDAVIWTDSVRSPVTPCNSLTHNEIDNLSEFSKAIGWQVIFGLNLGKYNLKMAESEAIYVINSLKDNLFSFQFGNEPDGYHSWNPIRSSTYGYTDYENEWNNYFSAVRSQLSSVPVSGPDIAYQSSWVTSYAVDEGIHNKLLTAHYYQNGPASDPSINISSLFTPIPSYANYFQVINNAALASNLPWRITECNSINGGGKFGVSDVFASALWALDFMWIVAEKNGQGVNFHDDNGGAYSPFAISNGITYARPIYYAFLAFKYGTNEATIIPTTVSSSKYKCSAYSCIQKGLTSITIINKEATQNLSFIVNSRNTVNTIHIARLTAPSINSTAGVKFCNSSVNSDGTFQIGNTEDINAGGLNSFKVFVPAASAAIIHF